MWKCPTCGEEIEEQFDSCWKCSNRQQPEPASNPKPSDYSAGLFDHWCRGWLVLLLAACIGGVASGILYVLSSLRAWEGARPFLALPLLLFVLPVVAHWLFVLFFGDEVTPLNKNAPQGSAESRANALLNEATLHEARGRAAEAIDTYKRVIETFPGTTASRDAQKSLDSLRGQLR